MAKMMSAFEEICMLVADLNTEVFLCMMCHCFGARMPKHRILRS